MINERAVALRSGATNYATLKEYMDRRKVVPLPFTEDAVVTVSGSNVALIDDSKTVATRLAIGLGTVQNAGLFATLLPGAVGTGSLNSTSDSLGNILNLVRIRDANTHDSVIEQVSGREVYGLIQAVDTAVDTDLIGASGSENAQISFVYIAANGTLTLTQLTGTYEFSQNNVYLERLQPTIRLEGGNADADALKVDALTIARGKYVVTTGFAAAEMITLSTGAGVSAGVSTQSGEVISLGANAGAFNSNNLLIVTLNGVEQEKGSEVIWDSAGSLHFALALDINDSFAVRLLNSPV